MRPAQRQNPESLLLKIGDARRAGIDESAGDGRIGVDTPVAQKRPVATRIFEQSEIDFGDENFFCIVGGFGNDAAEGIGDETAAPEFEAGAGGAIAEDLALLAAYAVGGGDVDAVGDGVGALDGLPRVVLGRAEFGLFSRVPANGGGIEENFSALERGEARALGIPLVPAD